MTKIHYVLIHIQIQWFVINIYSLRNVILKYRLEYQVYADEKHVLKRYSLVDDGNYLKLMTIKVSGGALEYYVVHLDTCVQNTFI